MRADLVEKARIIAVLRGVEVSDYLSKIAAPLIERDYKAERKKMASEDA